MAAPEQFQDPLPADRPARLGVLAARLSRTIGIARTLVEAGRTLDLTGIDDGIGILCAQSLDLPEPDNRQMLPALREVLGQVDALTASIRERAPPALAPRAGPMQ